MMKELADEFVSRGHHITVATFWPRYNLTEEASRQVFTVVSEENGVRVIRVKAPPRHKINYIGRGLSELISPYLLWREISQHLLCRIDAVMVYISPLPLAWVGYKIKKEHGAMFLLNIQDIFPQNAIDLGIMRNKLLIRFFEFAERKAYGWADRLTCHAESSRIFLIEKKGVRPGKIDLVSNWIDLGLYVQAERSEVFRQKWKLVGKFIFLFAGVLGPSQSLDMLITAAVTLRDYKDIVILFVGDGSEKDKIVKMAAGLGLGNVIFKPFVSSTDYPKLVNEADVGLISLSNMNRTPMVPGKIFGYMAASLPVLAFLNKESDGHQIIRAARCGYSEFSGDAAKVAQLMSKMFEEKDRLKEMGLNGHQYASRNFTKKMCIDKLEILLHT